MSSEDVGARYPTLLSGPLSGLSRFPPARDEWEGVYRDLALEAFETLTIEGVKARVVSLPSWHVFDAQDEAYRESVLPSSVTRRISIEQASTFGWERKTNPFVADLNFDD